MAKEIYSLSLDSIKLLCGLIRDLASVSDGILDTAICTDKTFSSYYIDLLLKQLKADSEAYTDEVASALTKLTAEVVTVEPTLDNTTNKINTILLYSPNGNDVYDQYLRLETQLISLGSTQISMADYIKTSEADNKYSTKTELKAVTDKIGTTALTTTAQTLTGSIEEVKGIAEQGTMLTVTKTQYDQLVAGQTVNIDGKNYTYDSNTYYVVKDDGDTITTTSTINASSTDSEVPTAKAVRLNILGNRTSNEIVANAGNSVLKFPLGSWQIYSSDLAKTLSDLPVQTGGRLEVLSNSVGTTTPWTGAYATRMYKYFSYSNGEYERYLYSSATPGVMAYDSGWRRVCTTKVADVPITLITYSDTTNYENAYSGYNWYEVKDGVCHISIYITCKASIDSWKSVSNSLPIPKINTFKVIHPWTGATDKVNCFIDETGNLNLSLGTVGGKYINTFSYTVKES